MSDELNKLIQKYNAGECNTEEEQLLNSFLDSFQDENEWDEQILGSKEKLKEKLYGMVTKSTLIQPNYSHRSKQHVHVWLKIAISILMFITTSAVIYYSLFQSGEPTELVWKKKITALGMKAVIKYRDGTKITLNGGSELKYPQNFTDSSREVYLDGEAFFEIVHNPEKPFIVHSHGIKIKDLGTKFNVNAYNDEKNISVALVEGKLIVKQKNSDGHKQVSILTPTQELIYNRSTELSRIQRFDLHEKIGWKDNILIFNDEPLKIVFKKLERAYGVKFELTDTLHKSHKFTANFNNEKLWTIVTVIQKLKKLDYKIEKENNRLTKIIFYKKQTK